jgi:hypothetical protein
MTNRRHIHEASLRVRYAQGGIPVERPHDGDHGGGRGWARSPLARAIADQEKVVRPRPPKVAPPEPLAPVAIHAGWFKAIAAD